MPDAPKTILLVEDEGFIALAETRQLQNEGFAVVHVFTGEEAIQKVSAEPGAYDLILMDINLGSGLDGTQAAQVILKDHDIPILFLSAHTEPEVVAKTEKITSYGYVVKNTGSTVLAASIKMAFKLHAAHQAIQRANERLGQAMEASRAGAWDWDILHNTFNWSPEFLEIFGLPPGTLAGFETWTQALHPEDREIAGRRIQESIEQKTNLLNDYRIILPGGEIRWIRATGRTFYAGDQPLRMIGLCMDITERKQAEDQWRDSQSRAQAMLSAIPDLMFSLDRQGVFLGYKADVTDLYAQSEATIIGKRNRDIAPPEFAELIEQKIRATLETGSLQTFDYRLAIPGRGMREYEARMAASGANEVVAIVRDITGRQRMEQSLRASEEMFRALFEQAGDYALILEPTAAEGLVIRDANAAACHVHGYSRQELIGQPISILDPQAGNLDFRRRWQQLLAGETLIFEVVHSRKDGSAFPVEVCAKAMQIAGDGPIIFSSERDITERKRAEEALHQALADKELLMRELQHRVKNSLATAASLVRLEQGQLADDQARAVFANTVVRLQTMALLYEQLSQEGRIDRVDLRRYLQDLVDALALSSLAPGSPVKIETRFDLLELEPKRAMPLGLIVNELVTNALKYAFPAGRAGVVRVELEQADGGAILCVVDDGVGMQSASPQSFGLGLKLVELLTRQLEGRLTIEGGQGVRVCVVFGR